MPLATLDGNEAAARIAYALDEVIAIYPITPSSPMGELADQWASEGQRNLWGVVPRIIEMQSEGGAAGAVHGSLQAGALTTTFTASQGLLLMLPNLYKIAGELTSAVIHVAARSLAAQGLSIFGDHQDVMACRATGAALLCSGSVQEAHDLAVVAHLSTLEGRVPFLHFFDGFRTSHELNKIALVTTEDLQALVDPVLVQAHRARGLSPDHPVIRGTAQNPDVYFQARETVNPYYRALPRIVQAAMDRVAARVGRAYRLFDYVGHPEAERVIVMMGSGAEAAHEAVDTLVARGDRVGLVKVRLYRPFSIEAFAAALPASARAVAVLDRTKEPGSLGEPLYLDVVTAVQEGPARDVVPRVIGGRYGLGSKEFTPAMAAAVLQELSSATPARHFTVGINDDLSGTSLEVDASFSTADPDVTTAVFFGLGSDGTVSANKNSIKIIGEETPLYAQGYFVYDSKKAGSTTVSHLRFGPRPIRSTYLVSQASFVACHQFELLAKLDVLDAALPGATVLLNSPWGPEEVWDHLSRSAQHQLIDRKLRLFVIDAAGLAGELGMGRRINTIMQTCFFALSGVLPREDAITAIKHSIEKTYGKRGEAVVARNHAAVDRTLAALVEVPIPQAVTSRFDRLRQVDDSAPEFVRTVTAALLAGAGDAIPVSQLPADGTWPVGTAGYEKRNIALEVPIWEPDLCIQCGKCVLVCPHGVIRAKVAAPEAFAAAPDAFLSAPARWKGREQERYTLQVAAEDCTGCSLCVEVCPAKSKSEARRRAINMVARHPDDRPVERARWDFFLSLPDPPREPLNHGQVKDVQLLRPLFEFSGACAGCGETPYLKLVTQLFGDRAVVANATGCSSIYGGNLPTTPWTANADGCGPAWSNSLFEDNAEFGLGMRLAIDAQARLARSLLEALRPALEARLVDDLLSADGGQASDELVAAQRGRVQVLKARLAGLPDPRARDLLAVADSLVPRSVWIVGGDGWAYDIGFGGLDHVLASGENVNLLVLDTEVYSNTGGQMSKATPRGAVAKFAAAGKRAGKKDLAAMAMTYGTAYVARVAMGANDMHTLRVLREAESYPGPSLVIAYSPCIAHGYDMVHGLDQQKAAVACGYWPLMRFDPRRTAERLNPLQLDSKPPAMPLKQYAYNETRYTMLAKANPEEAARLLAEAQDDVLARWRWYEREAAATIGSATEAAGARS
jgi:pyruvate-ferredoxin/flavodoxin oxidoreductase